MIEEKYVSFELAKILKSCGFFEGIEMFYDEDGDLLSNRKCSVIDGKRCCSLNIDGSGYLAPTLQMTMDWLNVERGLYPDISIEVLGDEVYYRVVGIYDKNKKKWDSYEAFHDSKEEAIERVMKYCLTEYK